MLSDEEFEKLKDLLAKVSDWDLLSVHSYLRLGYTDKKIKLSEIFEIKGMDVNFEMKPNQLLAYIEIEFQNRNLN